MRPEAASVCRGMKSAGAFHVGILEIFRLLLYRYCIQTCTPSPTHTHNSEHTPTVYTNTHTHDKHHTWQTLHTWHSHWPVRFFQCITVRTQICALYVEQGNTLESIVRRYHLDRNWRRLWNLNSHITNPFRVLHGDQTLRYGAVYTVNAPPPSI